MQVFKLHSSLSTGSSKTKNVSRFLTEQEQEEQTIFEVITP
jgi:hypothetical protein